MGLGDLFVGSDSSTRKVEWSIRKPNCTDSAEVTLMSTQPNVQPGDSFPVGQHSIKYTYNVEASGLSEQETCEIQFEVKGLFNQTIKLFYW